MVLSTFSIKISFQEEDSKSTSLLILFNKAYSGKEKKKRETEKKTERGREGEEKGREKERERERKIVKFQGQFSQTKVVKQSCSSPSEDLEVKSG